MVGLEIKLTEEGKENYEEVYNIVVDYIGSLKPEKYIYDEMKEKKSLEFRFKEKEDVSKYVCKLSSRMHYVPLAETLNSSVLFDDYDEETIDRVLKQMNPFNLIIVLSSADEL